MDSVTMSKLPRAEVCPGSMALPAVHRPGGVYAEAGNATHGTLEAIARGNRDNAPAWLVAVYDDATAGADAVYAERCFAWDPILMRGRDLGTHGRDYSGLRSGEIGGTADLVVVRAGAVEVYDYKSGFMGAPISSAQLSCLALTAASAFGAESATVGIIQIDAAAKTAYPKTATLDAFDLAREATRIAHIVEQVERARLVVAAGGTPDVRLSDDGCRYCPAKMACPGRTGAIASLASVAGLARPDVRIVVTPENAGAVWQGIEAMKAVLKVAEEEVKALARVSPVPLPDGSELWAVETSRESVTDADIVERIVAERYGSEAAASVVTIEKSATKGAIEALAKAKAKPREGAKDTRALLEAARAAGAITSSSFLTYTAKQKEALRMSDEEKPRVPDAEQLAAFRRKYAQAAENYGEIERECEALSNGILGERAGAKVLRKAAKKADRKLLRSELLLAELRTKERLLREALRVASDLLDDHCVPF